MQGASDPLHQLGGGRRGATGRQHVVHDEHPLPRLDRVFVQLQGIRDYLVVELVFVFII